MSINAYGFEHDDHQGADTDSINVSKPEAFHAAPKWLIPIYTTSFIAFLVPAIILYYNLCMHSAKFLNVTYNGHIFIQILLVFLGMFFIVIVAGFASFLLTTIITLIIHVFKSIVGYFKKETK
jgi:hypothetical protein